MQITIGKIGRSIEVDTARLGFSEGLPAQAEYVVRYGLTQSLNDAHAAMKHDGSVASADKIMALVEKKLEAIYAGIPNRVSRGPSDPLAAMVARLAREEVLNAIRAKGVKVASVAKEKIAELVAAHTEKSRERLTAAAQERLATVGEIAESVDLSGLTI